MVHLDNHQSSHKYMLSAAIPALNTKKQLLTGCKTAGKPSFQPVTPKRTDSTILSLAAKTVGKSNWTGCYSWSVGSSAAVFQTVCTDHQTEFCLSGILEPTYVSN